MLVAPARNTIRAERAAAIADGPTLAKGNRRFQVQRVSVTYRWDVDRWATQHAAATGAVFKKDGTPGLVDATRTFWGSGCPVWLTEIVNQLRPHGTPVTRTSEFEVQAP